MRHLKPRRYLLLIVLLFLTTACLALDRPIAIPPIAATPNLTDELGATDNPLILIGSEPLVRQAEGIAQRLKIDARAGGLDSGGSDHEPFLRAGVPAIFFFREDPLFHTPQDTPDRVRAEWLAAAGQITVQMTNGQ